MAITGKSMSLGNRWSFIGAAYAFVLVMLGTTLPTPLYPIYGSEFEFSSFMITIIYAVYAIGVIGALLVFGQLGDRIGHRYILIPGVIISAISALIFLSANGVTVLLIGRVLSGISAGLFTGTATATLVNLAPLQKKGTASMIASGINMLGLGLGPLLAGVFAAYFPYPLRLIFIVDFVILIPAFVAVWLMIDPVQTKEKARLEIQKLRVPRNVRSTFIRAVIPGFAGFSMLGLFTAVSPSFLQEVLHFDDKFVLGVIVFSIFAASAFSQLLFTNTSDRFVLPFGSATLIIGSILVGAALFTRSLSLLVIGAVVSGLGQGLSFRAGLASVNAKTNAGERGEVTSSFFVIVYIALSIPVVGVGLLAKGIGLQMAGIVFSIIVGVLALIALILLLIRRD